MTSGQIKMQENKRNTETARDQSRADWGRPKTNLSQIRDKIETGKRIFFSLSSMSGELRASPKGHHYSVETQNQSHRKLRVTVVSLLRIYGAKWKEREARSSWKRRLTIVAPTLLPLHKHIHTHKYICIYTHTQKSLIKRKLMVLNCEIFPLIVYIQNNK